MKNTANTHHQALTNNHILRGAWRAACVSTDRNARAIREMAGTRRRSRGPRLPSSSGHIIARRRSVMHTLVAGLRSVAPDLFTCFGTEGRTMTVVENDVPKADEFMVVQ